MIPRLPLALTALLATTSCAGLVANIAADKLSGEGTAFTSDDDPQLVRDAIPFGLKVTESLLEGSPDNVKLLTSACSGFTQYAYAFVEEDADELDATNPSAAKPVYARTKKLLRRAVGYGFRALAAEEGGDAFLADFAKDHAAALKRFDGKEDVPLLYWTGASLALLVSLSKDDMKLVGRLPEVEALMARALELDESWSDGAIHEFYLTYEAGKSVERAKKHMDRALELTGGKKIGPLVSWAEAVAVQTQDRKLFDRLLDQALAFDVDSAPRFRLVNLIAQRRARFLKSRAGDLFLEE